ncbi:cupin domain-containing protein [Aeromicrobium sp. 9AM]|uniref:cupin domain-containing protein n=1 Tax=Aeromicrobium sp. 9AM TaxID=2653126 RepID=UPI0012F4515E|nr:cupin domain-containing protein [Aeromicrobium sp. 9AM]VXB14755.1 conserved hypothetical protein [Aeromicrobium sp. 9AM]
MTKKLAETALLTADAAGIRLDHSAVPGSDVAGGTPTTGFTDLGAVEGVTVGIWEITPGIVTDTEAEEVFVVLSGRGRLTFEDESSVLLATGTVVHLRAGQKTRWTIYEPLRKIYVMPPDSSAGS